MDDKTGEYKSYLLDGGYMLGLGESARNEYRAFIEYDLSAADFDAYALIIPGYDALEE